ncbi:MAG: hypothetical protein P9L92_05925 [Candidatus Electryonea clarkiae]|nr:hypothetical protein [Candidatus Electryonea clarkiae]MDP8288778.1 hypothetical protein [Candidatus Electryonea clarkiae]
MRLFIITILIFQFALVSFAIPPVGGLKVGKPKVKTPNTHEVSYSFLSGSITERDNKYDKFRGYTLDYQKIDPISKFYRYTSFGTSSFKSKWNNTEDNDWGYGDTYNVSTEERIRTLHVFTNLGINIKHFLADKSFKMDPFAFIGAGLFLAGRSTKVNSDSWGGENDDSVWYLTLPAFRFGLGARYTLPSQPQMSVGLQLKYVKVIRNLGLNTDNYSNYTLSYLERDDYFKFSNINFGIVLTYKPA